MVKHRAEEARIAVRNIRRDDMEQLRGLEHEKEISMDEAQLSGSPVAEGHRCVHRGD